MHLMSGSIQTLEREREESSKTKQFGVSPKQTGPGNLNVSVRYEGYRKGEQINKKGDFVNKCRFYDIYKK